MQNMIITKKFSGWNGVEIIRDLPFRRNSIIKTSGWWYICSSHLQSNLISFIIS